MDKPKPYSKRVPELESVILNFGCNISENPPYVLVGHYKSQEVGLVKGIIAGATNEFHAHILRREIRKNGCCDIEVTEYHPSEEPTFSIEIFLQRMREKMAQKETVK
jgi:hypothetical protein